MVVGIRKPEDLEILTIEERRNAIRHARRDSAIVAQAYRWAEVDRLSDLELMTVIAYEALVALERTTQAWSDHLNRCPNPTWVRVTKPLPNETPDGR
jgi:hypothetical protein